MNHEHMRKIGSGTQWSPGRSGNLKGRPPKRRALREILREILDSDTLLGMRTSEIYRRIGKEPSVDDDPSVARLMLESAVAHFISKGNPSILAAVLDRIDGPAKAGEPEPEFEPLTCDQDQLDIFELLEKIRQRREGASPN